MWVLRETGLMWMNGWHGDNVHRTTLRGPGTIVPCVRAWSRCP